MFRNILTMNCVISRFLLLGPAIFFLHAVGINAETYFDNYKLNYGLARDAYSLNECIRLCLATSNCPAISYCDYNSACITASCSNIQLVSITTCKTILFGKPSNMLSNNFLVINRLFFPVEIS